jgi:hypothetical protein
LRAGGRDLSYGEHVPQALEWKPYIRQMHIHAGNLTFVNAKQAEEMTEKANEERRAKALETLRAGIGHAKARAAAAAKKREAMEDAYEALQKEEAAATALVEEAEKTLAKAEKCKGVPDMPEQPDAIKPPPAAKPKSVRDAEALEALKQAAKDRLGAVIAEVTAPERLGISVDLSSKSYKDLQAMAKDLGLASFGQARPALQDAVMAALKSKAVHAKAEEQDANAASEMSAAVSEAAGTQT